MPYDAVVANLEDQVDELEDKIASIREASNRRARADHAVAEDLSAENKRLRAALERIATHSSAFVPGWKHWSTLAEEALANTGPAETDS